MDGVSQHSAFAAKPAAAGEYWGATANLDFVNPHASALAVAGDGNGEGVRLRRVQGSRRCSGDSLEIGRDAVGVSGIAVLLCQF